MTVKELIEKLSEFDDDLFVLFKYYDDYEGRFFEPDVENVDLVKDEVILS